MALWEKRVDALMVLLGSRERRVITVDELRRGIEQLGAEAYDAMSYYERLDRLDDQHLAQQGGHPVPTSSAAAWPRSRRAGRRAPADGGPLRRGRPRGREPGLPARPYPYALLCARRRR